MLHAQAVRKCAARQKPSCGLSVLGCGPVAVVLAVAAVSKSLRGITGHPKAGVQTIDLSPTTNYINKAIDGSGSTQSVSRVVAVLDQQAATGVPATRRWAGSCSTSAHDARGFVSQLSIKRMVVPTSCPGRPVWPWGTSSQCWCWPRSAPRPWRTAAATASACPWGSASRRTTPARCRAAGRAPPRTGRPRRPTNISRAGRSSDAPSPHSTARPARRA